MQQRNIAFLDDIISAAPEANICALTHGGVIRSMLAYVLNMPLKGLFRFNVDYGSVTQIELTKDAVPKINFVNL